MIRGEANARFQSRYRHVLAITAALAVSLHAAGALVSPPYAPSPFQIRESPPEAWDVQAYEVVKPPKREVRPPLDPEPGSDDLPDLPPPPSNIDHIPPAPPAPQAPDFVVYDTRPVLVRSATPEYPDIARRAEAEGRVVVLATIDEYGRVIATEVLESTTIPILERAAESAAQRFLFRPARQREHPVRCQVVIPFTFNVRSR